jgi:hypothetical protein
LATGGTGSTPGVGGAAAAGKNGAAGAGGGGGGGGAGAGDVFKLFWSAHQRFFKLLCVSIKVPTVVEEVRVLLGRGVADARKGAVRFDHPQQRHASSLRLATPAPTPRRPPAPTPYRPRPR